MSTQAGFERLDSRLVHLLGSEEGCLELLERLDRQHRRAGRGLRGDEERVHELVLGAGLLRGNVSLLFDLVEEERPRTLLAQSLLALYAWDPASVVFATFDFEDQVEDYLAVKELVERLSEATGEGEREILKGLPETLSRRVMSYGLLDAMERPLGVMTPCFQARHLDLNLPGVRFDGVLFERDLEHGGPKRALVLQSEPMAEESVRALEEAQVEFLRFSDAEITQSFGAGLRVAERVTTGWGWTPLGDAEEVEDD